MGCTRIKLSLDFFLYNIINKNFSKDTGIGECNLILPQVIKIEAEDIMNDVEDFTTLLLFNSHIKKDT